MKLFDVNRGRCAAGLGMVLILAVLIAGCGGGSSSTAVEQTSSSGESSSGGESSSEGSSGFDAAALEAKLKPFTAPPTDIGITEPLKELPTGTTVTYLQEETGPAIEAGEGLENAAKALGFKFKVVTTGLTPQNIQSATQQIVEEEPEVFVGGGGFDPSFVSEQLQEMHEKGIKVVNWSAIDPPPNSFELYFLSKKTTEAVAAAVARYIILKSNGEANLLYVDQSVLSFAPIYGKAIEAVFKNECPKCTFQETDTLPEEVGTKIPAKVVSEVQKDPSIDWATFAYGAMSLGVPQALSAAGISEQLQIVNQSPEKNNYVAIKNGAELAAFPLNYELFAYYVADSIARLVTGQKVTNDENKNFSYLIEKSDITFDPNTEVWDPLPGFQAEFEELWGVK